jgi:hypothetical protein
MKTKISNEAESGNLQQGAVMRRAKKLKLYVWEDVLRDYSTGIAFAYAENSIEARKLVIEKLGYNHGDLCAEPREISAKEGFVKYGGG